MISVDLKDISLDRLRSIARELGLSNVKEREELEAAIKNYLSPDQPLAFSIESPRKPHSIFRSAAGWALLVSICAAAFTGLDMWADWQSAGAAMQNLSSTMSRYAEDDAKDQTRVWQQVVIYSIIERTTTKEHAGVSFEDIRNSYVVEATSVEGIDLRTSDLQPLMLKRILVDLMTLGLISQTLEDKYMINRSAVNPRAERAFCEERAKYAILHLLSTDGGKYTVHELGQVVTDKFMITSEEYNVLVNELIAARSIVIDDKKRCWSVSNPPPEDEVKEGGGCE